MAAPVPVPSLEAMVDTLVRLTQDIHGLFPRDSGRLYLACLALLYHLDVDNETIQNERERHGDDTRVPSLDAIPAMAAVWRDRRLLRALLRCLRSGSEPPPDGAADAAPAAGRKRALSIGGGDGPGPGPAKAPKTSLSPVPATARGVRSVGGAGAPEVAAPAGPGPGPHPPPGPRPAPDAPVAAATALYAALWPLPHWPAPLAAAFAEDCFGPRRWVDADVRGCRLLARNLALSLQTEAIEGGSGEGSETAEADRWVTIYRDFLEEDRHDGADAEAPLATGPEHRSASLSSTGSQSMTRGSADASLSMERYELGSDESSSGEEDEAPYAAPVGLNEGQDHDSSQLCQEKSATGQADSSAYPLVSKLLIQQSAVRQRFFGSNGCFARELLVKSLSSRLGVRSKQNSGLLTALPSFTTIPEVRELVADNLEKWLQSPALAGLARCLFNAVVKNMKNVGPPLNADLAVVQSIIQMHLKANQFNKLTENMVEVAKNMPHVEVIDRMYSHLLLGFINPGCHDDSSGSDKLKMIVAVHNAIRPEMSYKCLAGVLLHILERGSTAISAETTPDSAADCANLMGRVQAAVKALSLEIGHSFDGCALLDAILSTNVNKPAGSTADEENKARLMFQCVFMHVRCQGSQMYSMSFSEREWGESLLAAKRKLLSWFCTDFGPRYAKEHQSSQKFIDSMTVNGHLIPIPDYHGVAYRHEDKKVNPWLKTMRCMLMLECAESEAIKQFIASNIPLSQDELDLEAIRLCYEISRPVDDEMIWIVLRSCALLEGLPADMAIQVIENLFESCCNGNIQCLQVADPMIVWELYNMVQYRPSSSETQLIAGDIPLLALSGLWWRVTALALIMCAASVDRIGKLLWYESPTIRSIIKMITSNRYRFPSVDCDEFTRCENKMAEQRARKLEMEIAERLFLPSIKRTDADEERRQGSRTSERLRQKELGARSAFVCNEKRRQKRLLRAMHRAIILWDPVAPARKPPREAMDLFLCTEHMFDLAVIFQRSTHPDFLLMTLGGTSRGAIERAHDWLIPIISRVPSTIGRLPSSASCFLLLRSYSTSGGVELKMLSSPLLNHVKSCLQGKLGSSATNEALQLLLQDLASPEPEKRSCARRVLKASMTTQDPMKEENGNESETFLERLLHLDHIGSLVKDCIRFMASAARLERGQNLVVLMLALDKFVRFASDNSVEPLTRLPNLMLDLIATRAGVFSEAMDLFPKLRSWILNVIADEFTRQTEHGICLSDQNLKPSVRIKLCKTSVDKYFTLRLLEGSSIVLSMWRDKYSDASDEDRAIIELLVDNLFEREDFTNSENVTGLASAVVMSTSASHALIEIWLLLVKARSDSVARRAAMSAPTVFLPRLLLSSGLPRASMLTMSRRLHQQDDMRINSQREYSIILQSLTSSDSGIGHLAGIRKLQRRLAAYFRLNKAVLDNSDYSSLASFGSWHCEPSHEQSQSKRVRPKKSTKTQAPIAALANISAVASILTNVATTDFPEANDDCQTHIHAISSKSVKTFPVAITSSGSSGAQADMVSSVTHSGTCLSETVSLREIPLSPPTLNSTCLWETLFAAADGEDKNRFQDVLAKKCVMCWDAQQKRSCMKWILEHSKRNDIYSLDRMALFILHSCDNNDLTVHPAVSYPPICIRRREETCCSENITDLALGNASSCRNFRETAPWCLEMASLAATSKEQAQSIAKALRKRMSHVKGNDQHLFQATILYLHLVFPSWIHFEISFMPIEEAIPSIDVHVFSSAVDDRLINALCFLKYNGDILRSGRELVEIARAYPLHLLQKMRLLNDLLNADAMSAHPLQAADTATREEGLERKIESLFEGRTQHVSILYWGCTYSEELWLSLAEAVMVVPREILFSFGISVGLLDFLSSYLQILLIHAQPLCVSNKTARLKSKITDLLHIFEVTSPTRWQRWQNVVVEGSEIRNILKGIGIVSSKEPVA